MNICNESCIAKMTGQDSRCVVDMREGKSDMGRIDPDIQTRKDESSVGNASLWGGSAAFIVQKSPFVA